jgi:hypothetical protein
MTETKPWSANRSFRARSIVRCVSLQSALDCLAALYATRSSPSSQVKSLDAAQGPPVAARCGRQKAAKYAAATAGNLNRRMLSLWRGPSSLEHCNRRVGSGVAAIGDPISAERPEPRAATPNLFRRARSPDSSRAQIYETNPICGVPPRIACVHRRRNLGAHAVRRSLAAGVVFSGQQAPRRVPR